MAVRTWFHSVSTMPHSCLPATMHAKNVSPGRTRDTKSSSCSLARRALLAQLG